MGAALLSGEARLLLTLQAAVRHWLRRACSSPPPPEASRFNSSCVEGRLSSRIGRVP